MTDDYKKFVDNAEEYKIFFMIEEAAAYLYNMGLLYVEGRIKPKDVEDVKNNINLVNEQQNYLIASVKRFGVPELYSYKDGKKYSSFEYRKWFNHWDQWKKTLTNSEWVTVKNKLANNQSFDELLPKTKWNA